MKKLNKNGKIYIEKLHKEIAGYGFICRQSEDFAEISISTIKPFRNQGIGLIIANKMKKKIETSGRKVIYVTEKLNIPSNKIAKKCDFILLGEEYIGYEKIVN